MPAHKPTVFIISPFFRPNTGGVESHLKKLTEYLVDHGHRVIVSTYQPLMTDDRGLRMEDWKPLDSARGKGKLRIYRQSWFGRGWFNKLEGYFPLVFAYLYPGLLFSTIKVYRKHWQEVEVIHAHGFIAAAVALVLRQIHQKRIVTKGSYPRRPRIVVSTHAIYHFKHRPLLAFFMKRILSPFDYILAVGQPSREEIIRDLGIPASQISVHPNWLDLKTFVSPGRAKAKAKLGLKGFVVLFIGRLIEKKGAKVLLEVAREVKAMTFVFIGDGEMEPEVRAAAAERGANVVAVGRLSQHEPEELKKMLLYYSAADVMASPVQYDEGFATVYLEALACGTAILTARRGQLPYFLTDEVGVLLDEASTPKVKAVLERWLAHPEEIEQYQQAARPYAERLFSDENVKIITGSYVS